jgi:hypothetical protein
VAEQDFLTIIDPRAGAAITGSCCRSEKQAFWIRVHLVGGAR